MCMEEERQDSKAGSIAVSPQNETISWSFGFGCRPGSDGSMPKRQDIVQIRKIPRSTSTNSIPQQQSRNDVVYLSWENFPHSSRDAAVAAPVELPL